MSKTQNAPSRNAKGPFTAKMFGYRFGQGPQKQVPTVTEARKYAESFRDEAATCVIFDRDEREVGRHVRGAKGWERQN